MTTHWDRLCRAAALAIAVAFAPGGLGWPSMTRAQTACSELAAADPSAPRARRSDGLGAYQGFVENRGQWPSDVLFFARQQGIELTVRADALVIQPAAEIVEWDREARPPREPVVRMPMGEHPLVLAFEQRGQQTSAQAVEARDGLPTLHHFLTEPLGATDCRGFETVVLREVAPGISIRLRIDHARYAYDVIADPGADLDGFSIRLDGASDPVVDDSGLLLVATKVGFVGQRIDAAWQTDPATGARSAVMAAFDLGSSAHDLNWSLHRLDWSARGLDTRAHELEAGNADPPRIGFAAPDWDRTRELVIDPTLLFLTYVGGPVTELPDDIQVDADGNSYVICRTGTGAPVTAGSYQPISGGGGEVWLGKLLADGSQLLFGTFIGSNKTDEPEALDIAPDGAPIVVGQTWSLNYPTTPGSYQPIAPPPAQTPPFLDKSNIFVTKVAPTGDALIWSTFVGVPEHELATAVTVLDDGDVVVSGEPFADMGPLPDPQVFDATFNAGDKMILKLSGDGTALEWLTYFRTARILCLAHDAQGEIVFGGDWNQDDGPLQTTPGAFQATTTNPPTSYQADGFVARLSADAHQLRACSHLGGSNSDTVWELDVDASGCIYTVLHLFSMDFPTTPGAFYPTSGLNAHGAVAKLLPHATGLVWATYLGSLINGGGASFVNRLVADEAGNVHVLGSSNEPGYPTTPDALQQNYIGPFPSDDAHYTKLDAFGEALVYSTWIGGNGQDGFGQVDTDVLGRAAIAILSSSPNLPTTAGAYDKTLAAGGSGDLAVLKFDLALLPWRVLGDGLGGTYGEIPNLAGRGALTPGSITRLSVRGARPSGVAWMVVGFSTIELPLLGGTLVPSPDIALPFPTGAQGSIDASFSWPSLAAGTNVWFQCWSYDPGAPEGWAASNALRVIAQ
jgi:Beta-propeller repeat